MPETYGPVLLRQRAKKLSKESGHVYISILDASHVTKASEVFKKTLARPWLLMIREPIVLIASIYLSIIYGTIYMFLGAFAIVYQEERGWNAGIGGLAFLGLAVGELAGLAYTIPDNRRYQKLGKQATPESRLPPAMAGAFALPIGMFAFAWTNGANLQYVLASDRNDPAFFYAVRKKEC